MTLFLKTKNFSDKKLAGAIKGIGINLAILGSIPEVIKPLRRSVLSVQKVTRLIKYLTPDLP